MLTSEVLLELDEAWEAFSFGALDFCFAGLAGAFREDVLTEPMTPSTDGVDRAWEVLGRGASGK